MWLQRALKLVYRLNLNKLYVSEKYHIITTYQRYYFNDLFANCTKRN